MDSKEILKLSFNDQLSFWTGQMCIAIGSGELDKALARLIFFYQTEAFERGQASAKKVGGKNG